MLGSNLWIRKRLAVASGFREMEKSSQIIRILRGYRLDVSVSHANAVLANAPNKYWVNSNLCGEEETHPLIRGHGSRIPFIFRPTLLTSPLFIAGAAHPSFIKTTATRSAAQRSAPPTQGSRHVDPCWWLGDDFLSSSTSAMNWIHSVCGEAQVAFNRNTAPD